MKRKQSIFKEDRLKKVIRAAVLMASVDQDFDQKEKEVIEQFLTEYWDDSYGEAKNFLEQVFHEFSDLADDETRLAERIEELSDDLVKALTKKQRPIVSGFLGQVMLADNRLDKKEAILLGTFRKKLQSDS